MIHTGRPMARGAEVEIRRGDHVIVAKVMWREGGRAGLKSDERVPIEDIVTLGQSPVLQLTAATAERRKYPRPEERSLLQGRAIEFAGVLLVSISLAAAGFTMVQGAFARPLAAVETSLER